jgi:type IV pilus assembly protein PilX
MRASVFVRATHRQRGLSVLFAMLSMVALSFAAAGLVRATSSNGLVVGNLSLKADTAVYTDVGTEAAIRWLDARGNVNLEATALDDGYSATSMPSLDPTGGGASQAASTQGRVLINWKNDNCQSSGGAFTDCRTVAAPVPGPNGNSYQFFIARLCLNEGAVDSNSCASDLETVNIANQSKDGIEYQQYTRIDEETTLRPSYRIIVRAAGPRNTVTYTETIVRK